MATLREYFDTDIKHTLHFSEWSVQINNVIIPPTIRANLVKDLEGNAKYWYFFVDETADINVHVIAGILNCTNTEKCFPTDEGDTSYIEEGWAGYSEKTNSSTLVFTRRIFIYIDRVIEQSEKLKIKAAGAKHGYDTIVRDLDYAIKRSQIGVCQPTCRVTSCCLL